ncbi:MAG: metallophosphoesterase [Spirochaetia bacterium]|nr:metallophosphoesterase [Spirochaetia bacterium]
MKHSHIVLFIGIVSILYSLVFYYFYRRFLKPFRLKGRANIYAFAGLFIFVYSTFLPFFLMRFKKESVTTVSWIAYLFFGFIFTLFPVMVSRDSVLILFRTVKKYIFKIILMRWIVSDDAPQDHSVQEISRREFLVKSNYAVLGFSTLVVGLGAYQARKPPRVYESKIPIAGLPDHFDGFKIVQISDIHLGLLIDGKYLSEVVRHVNELKPDLVAITGDLVDGTVSQLRSQAAVLKDISSVHGSYFVTGNHEYYSGVEDWLVEIEKLGVKVLMNDHDIIRKAFSKNEMRSQKQDKKNLIIAGVPDHRAGPNAGHLYEPLKAIQGANLNDIKILLAHQPTDIDLALDAGYHLQLSGHTHGGQFFPYNMAVPLFFRYNAGLYQHAGQNGNHMMVYVNRGTGYWGPPLRTGVPSEISLLTLVKA